MSKDMRFWVCIFILIGLYACQSGERNGDLGKPIDKLFTLLPPDFTGVDFKNPVTESEKENHLINDMLISGAGVAVGDINNDDLPDLFLPATKFATGYT